MGFWELFLTGVGLSADAFAAALCQGLHMKRLNWARAALVGLFFGGFQALMPLLGYLLGSQLERYIRSVDHWIVFALLLFIGGKMVVETLRGGEEEACKSGRSFVTGLLLLAVATSIDALAVGISFAFLQVTILPAVALIGATTFALSALGVGIGSRFGTRFQRQAGIAGGVILMLIGIKILLEHLGVL